MLEADSDQIDPIDGHSAAEANPDLPMVAVPPIADMATLGPTDERCYPAAPLCGRSQITSAAALKLKYGRLSNSGFRGVT